MAQARSRADEAPPQFYQWPMVLDVKGHRHAGIRAAPGCSFARKAMSVPLRAGEFADAVSDYPIVFTEAQTPVPLAILGYDADDNLFVGADGSWRLEAYLPLYVRRYPFIGLERVASGGKSELSLGIDVSSDLFVPRAREGLDLRLFDDAGQLTEVGRSGAALCSAWSEGESDSVAFAEALVENRLLQPGRIEMKLADGHNRLVDGFLAVNEELLRKLPDAIVLDWHQRGWLDCVILHLASQHNWARLATIGAMARRLRASLEAKYLVADEWRGAEGLPRSEPLWPIATWPGI
ncbi:MAG: SapC family protein [Alphaproteobacteria bacterium]|nr:SapC family protein [Alphaproteobacteria bacterium]